MSVKIKSIIASIVLCVVLAGVGIGIYCAWPAIKGVITDNSYYTSEDLQDSYNKGYEDALKNKTELEAQVEYYKGLTDEYYLSILSYQEQTKDFQKQNENLQSKVSSLESDKSDLQSQVSNLQEQIQTLNQTISENNKKISDFERQIEQKESEIANLKSSGENKDSEITNLKGQIETLRGQISNLQTLNSQLETTNQSNLTTIQSLNAQISTLNAQIVAMQNQYQSNVDNIASLNEKISQLEKSVEYYEEYIKNLESGDKVVATFEFNGTVINIQILQKGGKVLFPNPDSTTYVVFNYWETESGEKVQDTSSYTISESTKFVANITQKFDVKFSVDGTVKESQIVVKGGKPTAPSLVPSKVGYDFDGWTLNGSDVVDPTQQTITQTTTFIAKFTQKFTVTFMYEDETKSTQEVRSGGHAQDVHVDSTAYKRFNGWKVNGVIVTVEEYEISGATTFIADITYFYDVKFMVSDGQYGQTQIIEYGKFATVPDAPSMAGYNFEGWTVNGTDIVDISSYPINSATIFKAKFVSLKFESVEIKYLNGFSYKKFRASYVWSDGVNVYFSDYDPYYKRSYQYVFDRSSLTWKVKKWNGFNNLFGPNIWTDGTDIFYSASSNQYVLNKETSTWEVKSWNGYTEIGGQYIWTDGLNYYYSTPTKHYVLNKETSTWEVKSWNGYTEFGGQHIWTDGTDIYYSYGSKNQYVLNKETSTWEVKSWDCFDNIYCENIWYYNNSIYMSFNDDQYVLDKNSGKWMEINWDGLTDFSGVNIWTDGIDVYFTDDGVDGSGLSYRLTRSEA